MNLRDWRFWLVVVLAFGLLVWLVEPTTICDLVPECER